MHIRSCTLKFLAICLVVFSLHAVIARREGREKDRRHPHAQRRRPASPPGNDRSSSDQSRSSRYQFQRQTVGDSPHQERQVSIEIYSNGAWQSRVPENSRGYGRGNSQRQRAQGRGYGRQDARRTEFDLNALLNALMGNDNDNTNLQVVNKPKPFVHPYSDELIRLRGSGKFMNMGMIQVYRAGQWGFVCDDSWDLQDASVACKQLGFTRGAVSAVGTNQSMPTNQFSDGAILMDDMECSGRETTLQQCSYNTRHDCSLDEAASVTCYGNDGCPEGWTSGFGKCYKFFSKAKGIKLAGTVCARYNASLVNIESVEENHFLSNLIKNSELGIHQWYTGGKKYKGKFQWYKLVQRKRRWIAKNPRRSPFRTKRAVVSHDRWFPGWPSNNNMLSEPSDARKHDCLTLSDEFQDPLNDTTVVDYFYWKADRCRQKGGIDFICQIELEEEPIPVVEDCYEGDGSTYRGNADVTDKGTMCESWTDSVLINERNNPEKGLGDHNHCRNPDGDARPWCWVDHKRRRFGFCNIPQCSEASKSTAAPPTTTAAPSDLNCPDNEFYCNKQRTCIPASFRCDNEPDCTYAEDEDGCEYSVTEFTKTEDSMLQLMDWRATYKHVTYIEVTDETCARKCTKSTEFICRSFIYDSQNRSCDLSVYNSNMQATVIQSRVYDYYEMKSQQDCRGKFQCNNTFCIDRELVCNGKDDCKDFSDELTCESDGQNENVTVQLVGGEEHSGTVQITYRGYSGVICDDHWDVKAANVICRMLGYRGAKEATVMNYFNYLPDESKFLLDDVKCTGNELSIKDCERGPWKMHDCSAYEIAGVECQISKVCEVEQFKCRNDICVEAAELCDGKNDCGDNSDELDCRSIVFALTNGSRPWEGRVEVLRNGLRGTICDDQWDDEDAAVLCRTLGFRYGGEAVTEGYFGAGEGPVWLDNLECTGRERSLESCQHNGWGKHDCDHSEDAGVKCYIIPPRTTPTTTTTTTTTTTRRTTTARRTIRMPTTTEKPALISVRLVGGVSNNEGNVEIVINNEKYRVCDDYWDNDDATVICRMLGYSGTGIATEKSLYGQEGEHIIFDNVDCDGTESDIGECSAIVGVNKHDCGKDEFAGVVCPRDVTATPGPAATLGPHPSTDGVCGYKPYDHMDLFLRNRRRRSPITGGYSGGDDDLYAPRTVDRLHIEKIVGGNFATHGEHPWQVNVMKVLSIRYDNSILKSHHCGAVIISEYWLLSAAHCFYQKRKTEFLMVVGDHHQKTQDRGEQEFAVEELILHEDYSDSSKDYDIALIKIKPKDGHGIEFNNYVQAACLPRSDTPYNEGMMCTISGWGNARAEADSYRYYDTLKAAEVPLISHNKCNRLYNSPWRTPYTDRMMCAGFIEGGVDTCDGDSGGPLTCNYGGVHVLVGITSWGQGCAQPNAPGVYARVTAFLRWIDNQIAMHSESYEEKKIPTYPTSN